MRDAAMKRRCGFTLIERLVVIAIIALLMAHHDPGLLEDQDARRAAWPLESAPIRAGLDCVCPGQRHKLVGGHDGHTSSPSVKI